MTETPFTERQLRYFAAMRASLERETGRSLAEWVAIARTCPQTKPRARLDWFKRRHGLLQNRASLVLSEAFGGGDWEDPARLLEALWTERAARAIYEALDGEAMALAGAIRTPRKGYTAWARAFQFAAAKPVRRGGVLLGLALSPEADSRLAPANKDGWSERLNSHLTLASPAEVDATIGDLMRGAWEAS